MFGWGAAVVVGAAIVASVADYLFPVHYFISAKSAGARCLFSRSEIGWENVRRIWLAGDGVKLSPLSVRSRREVYRGVFLRFAGNRQEVLDVVQRCRSQEAAAVD
ncbi:MAG: hypothetical protein IT209_06310 [Armatimonadetes bacterium]|nr:hypothetical protein [Armatimonadota bacterium]